VGVGLGLGLPTKDLSSTKFEVLNRVMVWGRGHGPGVRLGLLLGLGLGIRG
jgi:hypothetical protein